MVLAARSFNVSSEDLADEEQVADFRSLLERTVVTQLEDWHEKYHKQFQEKVLLSLAQLRARSLTYPSAAIGITDDDLPLQSKSSIEFCRSRSNAQAVPVSAVTMPPRRRRPSSQEDEMRNVGSMVSVSQPPAPSAGTRTGSRNSATHLSPEGPRASPSSASGRSRTPSLPPDLPGLAPEDIQAGASDRSLGGRRRSRAATDRMSSMQAIDRLSHVCILNSQSVSHDHQDSIEDELGCWFVLALGNAAYVFLSVLACIGTIPLIYLQFMGYMCSASFAFVIAINSLYNLLAISCGCFLRSALQSEDLQLAFRKLTRFVNDVEFDFQWHQLASKERRQYFAAWLLLLAVAGTTLTLDASLVLGGCLRQNLDEHYVSDEVFVVVGVCSFISFAMASALVFILAYVHSNLLLGLDKILDCWVGDIVNTADFVSGVRSWNSIQALLKSASRELATSFLSLQVCGSLGLMIWLTGSLTFLWRTQPAALPFAVEIASALPLTCLFLLATRLCAHGAALTEKCRNIPALVNQIPGPTGSIDVSRQYLVRFITDSAAGFIVKGVTLTQAIFLRQVYFLGTLFSGLLGVLLRIFL